MPTIPRIFPLIALSLTLASCGGGGGDPPNEAPEEHWTRFEFAPYTCAFDNRDAMELAKIQFPDEFDYCLVSFIGNTENGKGWPACSWPSTPHLPACKKRN